METTKFRTIDEYIASFPPEVQERLQSVRRTIHEAVPEAEEKISYNMPTFALNGNLVHFSAFKRHIGMYGHTDTALAPFEEEAAPYLGEKKALRFPYDQPIPHAMIRGIVQACARERLALPPSGQSSRA